MSLNIEQGRPNLADKATVKDIDILVYPDGGALVIPPTTDPDYESTDIAFTEVELLELALAATWAANRVRELKAV